jgi:hypothetical protein
METPLKQKLIRCYKDEMISFLESNPECFNEAIELALTDEQPYSWRAAWLIWSCMEKDDARLQKHLKKIINSIKTKQDGHQRELIKILLMMNLNKVHEGKLFALCLDLWEDVNKDPSVRFTALKMLLKIAKNYKELFKEISILTQDQYLESLSPGVKKSISKLLNEFNRSL